MYCEKINVKNKDSQDYAALYLYLLDDSEELAIETRPAIIICPGDTQKNSG